MPVVGCPKCKKKYKLSDEMLGKTVQCSDCKTKFKTSAGVKRKKPDAAKAAKGTRRKKKPPAAGDKPSGASEASLNDVGLSGKINSPLDLFSQPIPDQRAPSPLGNFVLEDPGFGQVQLHDDEDEDDDSDEMEVDDDMKQLLANPALKSLAQAQGKKKSSRTIAKPSGFREIKLLSYFIVALGSVAILCYLVSAVFLAMGFSQVGNAAPEVVDAASPNTAVAVETLSIGAVILMVGLGVSSLTYLLSLFYWPMANANTTAMGARGQSYTPFWMVLSWFIPLANLIWTMQGISETYKASKRPSGKKWQKLNATLWQAPVWTLAIIASSVCNATGSGFASQKVATFTSQLLGVVAILLTALAVFCIISIVMNVTKAQYENFES